MFSELDRYHSVLAAQFLCGRRTPDIYRNFFHLQIGKFYHSSGCVRRVKAFLVMKFTCLGETTDLIAVRPGSIRLYRGRKRRSD